VHPRAGIVIAVAATACGPAPARVADPIAAPARSYRRGPIAPVVVPAALGDPGALARIPYAAHVVRYGSVELALGGGPSGRGEPLDSDEPDRSWPVIAEAGDRVRVVSTADDVHLALWVLRDDLATVAIDDVVVGASPGAIPAPSGGVVELRSGASIEVAAADRAAAASRVELVADVAIDGWVPSVAVGKVFAIRPEETLPFVEHSLGHGTVIRATAGPSAPVLAVVRSAVGVALSPPSTVAPGWAEVRVILPYARIRGFVSADEVIAAPPAERDFESFGAGGVGGRVSIVVPVGTCLYATADGEVVGVTVGKVRHRLVTYAEPPGWWNAIVQTEWGLLEVYLRDAAGNRDFTATRLESCLEPGPAPG
jgi:hypothetical protein